MINLSTPILIGLDSEFNENQPISLQVAVYAIKEVFLFINRSALTYDEYALVRPRVEQRVKQINDAHLLAEGWQASVAWVDFSDNKNIIEEHLVPLLITSGHLPKEDKALRKLWFIPTIYFSCKDLQFSFGWNNLKEVLGKKGARRRISQQRNITGNKVRIGKYRYTIKDLYGWESAGLAALAAGVGCQMKNKSKLDKYKANVKQALLECTEDFIDYALDDAIVLGDIIINYESLVKDISKNVLGVDYQKPVPMTNGRLVAEVFEEFLLQLSDHPLYKYALVKLGIPSKEHNTLGNYVFRRLASESPDRIPELKFSDLPMTNYSKHIRKQGDRKILDYLLHSGVMRSCAYSQATVKELARLMTTAAFAALVQGGRCNNEYAKEYRCNKVLDIDLSSCYGSALRKFLYFIGLPSVWGWANGQEHPTIRQWFKENEHELVDGRWLLIVRGRLSFSQDLVYSKDSSLNDIHRAVFSNEFNDKDFSDDNRDDDAAHIDGNFILLRKEIVNGVITSDIWKAIKAVSSNNELNEWLELEVVAAVAYKKSDECATIEEWIDAVVKDKGTVRATKNTGQIEDTRTRKYFVVHLENFIGPLVNKRNEIKKAKKSAEGDEKTRLSSLDTMLKRFVNTLYGVLASPYFSIGNTLVANHITARARLGVWMLNKALRTRQSITDGGIYEPSKVAFLDSSDKLPGFDILANRERWLDRRRKNRRLGPMGGLNWEVLIKENMTKEEVNELAALADKLALEHVNTFWANYGLQLPFAIEHKASNTSVAAAYFSKGDYALKLASPEANNGERYLFKIRGAKKHKDPSLRKHPKFELYTNIVEDKDEFPKDLRYDHTYIMKINKYIQVLESKGYAHLKNARPGDMIVEERTAKFNNLHMPIDLLDEYRRRDRRGKRKDAKLFERHADKGISGVHKAMMEDNLR